MKNVFWEKLQEKEYFVFGHRGAKAYAPMNTIPAFELALEQGADGIELDVHLSKDKQPVIVHDFTVDETTNSEGLVKDMTLAGLKELDAGGWFDEKFSGVQIPTLDEVFEAVGQKMFINVEIKATGDETDGVEQIVADCIQRHAMQERVVVSSFNPPTLLNFRKIMPDVLAGFLYMQHHAESIQAFMQQGKFEFVHPHHEIIDAEYMNWAHKNNYLVNTWTVNGAERAIKLQGLGVKTIITDNPDTIIETLQ